MPDVIIESPDIERLVAQRVRPVPPKRLGVRIPDILPQAEIPPISLPSRPIPKEREPDMDLTNYFGGLSRIFGDADQNFESGLAFLKKGAPVEALTFFNKTRGQSGAPLLKAAGQFWAAETLIRLGRLGEADLRRKELLRFSFRTAGPYKAAARYALADESCRVKDYQTCLTWLKGNGWVDRGFASAEARFLHAWILIQQGGHARAMEILSGLASKRTSMTLMASVVLGHMYFQAKNYVKAAKAYGKTVSSGKFSDAGDRPLIAEALHGIGWTRLHLGKPREAVRIFNRFLRRFPNHPIRQSAEAGAVAALLETRPGEAKKRLRKFIRSYPGSRHIGPLRLQLAWAQFRRRKFSEAGKSAASVSDQYPLGRIYRLGRVIEGLSLYHLGKVRKAYGVLRTGADQPPAGESDRLGERSAARSAAMATAFAAFRLKDYSGAQAVLEHWAFLPGSNRRSQAADSEAALWFGEASFEAGDLVRARRAFEKISRNSKEWYRARAGLAWIDYRNGNWKRAAKAFDQVFSMKPSGPLAPEALARAGDARFNQGNFSGAIQAFNRIEKEFAGGPVARKALVEKGKLLFRRDRYDEAAQAFETYLKKYPKSGDAQQVGFLNALIPFRRGRYKTARTRLLAFAERNPKSSLAGIAYLHIGDAFYNEGQFLQADRIYRLMKTRFPKHPRVREATYGLILTRLQRQDFGKFISEAQEYIERYGDDDLSIALGFQIGEVLLTRGDLAGALRAYREIETRHAQSDLAAHALLRISDIYKRRKEIDASLDAYESLMVRYPKSPLHSDALFGSGETLAKIGRCAEASKRLKDFLNQYPRHDYNQLALYEVGRCSAKQGNYQSAIRYLKKAIENDNTGSSGVRANASLLVAAILSKQGKYNEASRALGAALLSNDQEVAAEAHFTRADILARRKDSRAASEFLKLTYKFPKQTMWVTRAYERAGDLYESAGRRATALRIFQKMRQIAPKGPLRKKARQAISRLVKAVESRR